MGLLLIKEISFLQISTARERIFEMFMVTFMYFSCIHWNGFYWVIGIYRYRPFMENIMEKHEVENTFLNGIWNLVAIKITLKGYCDLFLRTAWCDWKNDGMCALFPGKGTNDFCGNGVVRIRFNFTVKVKRTSYAKIPSPSVRLKILVGILQSYTEVKRKYICKIDKRMCFRWVQDIFPRSSFFSLNWMFPPESRLIPNFTYCRHQVPNYC